MKAFVTGGAGFIGSHLVDKLLSENHNICVYDNLSSGKEEYIRKHFNKKNFRFIKADLLDIDTLKKELRGYDIVFHLASNPDIAKSMEDTSLDLNQGIIATYNVLEAMRINNIKRIVFTSGSGVYGDVGETYTSENFAPLIPISMYGASKLSAEGLICAFCNMFDMKAWIFRLANVVGGRQTHGVIVDFIDKLKRNKIELEILGDGEQSKSYLYISDCIDSIFFCLEHSNEQVNIFNVATNDYLKVSEIADIVVEEMKLKNVKYKYTGGNRGWKGDVPIVRLDTKKINNLGWRPKFSSREAVRKAVQENLLCRQ